MATCVSRSEQKEDDSSEILVGPDLNASRSPFDKKVYRHILLPNGLRALLVSDTIAMTQTYNSGGIYDHRSDVESDDDAYESEGEHDEEEDGSKSEEEGGLRNAAAAMVVGAGSMHDPPECQGLAHFLEHLLFMGSKKYPEENAYDEYISKHGGSDNAWTEYEHTVYHFEIPQEHLKGALDMFAQFFTHPLMLESSVERELKSIESEFQLVKNSDSCRVQHLMCHTCGHDIEEHPIAKFSWGNLRSLQDEPKERNVDPLERLWAFYKEYYFASVMRLVVIGAYSLDALQEYVVQSFSDIPGRDTEVSFERNHYTSKKDVGMPFTEACLGKVFYIAPVGDRHALSITWQVPSQIENWKSKPCDYLAHLIGHEAEGSLLASLKAKSWATACCAGVGAEGYENSSSHALFIVSITLSEEGVSRWQKIVTEVYQYIGMLRYHCENGLPRWIFDELQSIQEVSHRYDDEPSPEDFVETMAETMAPVYNLPASRLLDGSALLFDYDPAKVKNLLDVYFSPFNSRIDLASAKFGRSADFENVENAGKKESIKPLLSGDTFDPQAVPPEEEPIFGTRYWRRSISDSLLQEWSEQSSPQLPPPASKLSLPKMNEYVPSKFDLKPLPPADSDHPLLNCSIKLQTTVGKRKQWFAAVVTRFDKTQNRILVSYEDEEEKWHTVDQQPNDLTHSRLTSPDFEGSLDKKRMKYRIVALSVDGKGVMRKFGGESDFDVEDGFGFPPIPPTLPASRLPQTVCTTKNLKLWHLQDRIFKRPVAELRLCLYCADANKSPLHSACADLLVYLVSDVMAEESYMASVCDLGSSISVNDSGFTLRVHGFDDKLMNLFLVMFELLLSFRVGGSGILPHGIESRRFDLCCETYRRRCINGDMKASKLSSSVRVRCLRPNLWSSNEKLKSIEGLDIPKFMTTITSILGKIGMEGLYHGNVDEKDSKFAEQSILRLLEASGGCDGLARKKYPKQFVLQVPTSKQTLHCVAKDPMEPNRAVEVYFQVGKDNTFDRVMADLLMEMMYEPLYDQVRTKDQFGYQVSCDSRWTDGVIGMHIQVVSSSKTAEEIDARIEQFLTDYRQILVEMTQSDFLAHMAGLAKQKLDMFNSMSDETGHYWSEIRNGRYLFQVERVEVQCLKRMSKSQALEAYDKWLYPADASRRRRLAVHVMGGEFLVSKDPELMKDGIENHNDNCVKEFHRSCKNQTFGKIY